MSAHASTTPPTGVPETEEEARGSGISKRVFFPSGIILLAFVALVVLAPDAAGERLGTAQDAIITAGGWYYVLLVVGFLAFCVYMGVSRFGGLRLGDDDEEPEFSAIAWFAMLFSAGMGIGLVFFGVAEPLTYLASPPPAADPVGAPEASQAAMTQTFLHWGMHAWAIYAVMALAVAVTSHRRGRPIAARWVLEPLVGDRVKGRLGDAVDTLAVVSTLFGVANSLGFGVLQISAGLEVLGAFTATTLLQVTIIGLITLAAVISVVTGLSKGIKWLSSANLGLGAALLVFVLVTGPTLFLLRSFVTNIGDFLQAGLGLMFQTGAYGGAPAVEWQGQWTAFYWASWIAWSPYVGVFIARISRGRTIREFMAGVLLVPTLLSFLWFTVVGGTALYQQVVEERGLIASDGTVATDTVLFTMLQGLPLSTVAVVAALVLVTTFFVTSSDSGSLVVDMLASGGNPDPPTWSRVFWAVTEGVVAATLIVAGAAAGSGSEGALNALRAASVCIALPFTFILVAAAVATYKDLHGAVREEEQAERLRRTAAMVAVVMSSREGQDGRPVTVGVPVADLTEHGPAPDDLRTGDVVGPDGARRPQPQAGSS